MVLWLQVMVGVEVLCRPDVPSVGAGNCFIVDMQGQRHPLDNAFHRVQEAIQLIIHNRIGEKSTAPGSVRGSRPT